MKPSILLTVLFTFLTSSVWAFPTLQLDIGGGFYDSATETTIANTNNFTLYALLNDGALLNKTFYISASVAPIQKSDANLGSFTFNGQTVRITEDMVYGTPPFELIGTKDLQSHGIFDTYYREFQFSFGNAMQVTPYNVQDNPSGADFSGTGMYYVPFVIDVSGITVPHTFIHFDLYSDDFKSGTNNLLFAPFSHDAQSPVPEPSTGVLLAFGLLGLVVIGKRKLSKP